MKMRKMFLLLCFWLTEKDNTEVAETGKCMLSYVFSRFFFLIDFFSEINKATTRLNFCDCLHSCMTRSNTQRLQNKTINKIPN